MLERGRCEPRRISVPGGSLRARLTGAPLRASGVSLIAAIVPAETAAAVAATVVIVIVMILRIGV